MYISVVHQGAILFRLYITEGTKAISTESIAVGMQTVMAVHGLEVFIAYAFGMVSLEGVQIRFIYEHHLPVFFMALAGKINYSKYENGAERYDHFSELLFPIMILCMIFLVNEVSMVIRTFVSDMRRLSLWLKLMHHLVGIVDISIVSTMFTSFGFYCIWYRAILLYGSYHRLWACILMIYMGSFRQPGYVKRHYRAIKRTYSKLNAIRRGE